MIGSWVEVPTSIGDWCEGEVISTNEKKGTVTIRTDEGEILMGCESQIVTIMDCAPIKTDPAKKQQ